LVDELLWTDRLPVAVPDTVGSNWTSSVTARPGLKVTGKVAPEMVKVAPLRVAELTVTAAVPVEAKVTVCVDGVLIVVLPNGTLLGLIANVGMAVPVGTGSVILAGTFCAAFGLRTPILIAVVPGAMLKVPCSRVGETKSVATPTPAHCNCEAGTKPEPCTTNE
jgi:hypothetical protein